MVNRCENQAKSALVPEFDWSDLIESLSHGMPGMKESMPPGPWAYSILPLSHHFQGAARCSTVIFRA